MRSNNYELFEFFVENGAEVKCFPLDLLFTGLASLNEDGRIFEKLIECGYDVKTYTWAGRNLLMRAVQTEYCNAVVKLVDKYGINVNESDAKGNNTFLYASKAKDSRIIDFLVERGAVVTCKSHEGRTAFQLACDLSNEDFDRVVKNGVMEKLFYAVKPDLNVFGSYGLTPLTLAASRGNMKFFNLLIENGADIMQPSSDGSLLINYAIKYEHYKIAERLFEPRAVKIPPLHFLAQQRHFNYFLKSKMRKLLSYGADFAIRDHNGRTALHIAAIHRHFEFMEEIVTVYEADINAQDKSGKRPIDLTDDAETIRWLLDHGSKPKQKWYDIFTCCMN